MFGARGSANFLSRCTAIAAALFFVNCLVLAWIVRVEPVEESLLDNAPAAETVPTAPGRIPLEQTIPE